MMKLRMPEGATMLPMTKPLKEYVNGLFMNDSNDSNDSNDAVATAPEPPRHRLLSAFKVEEG